MANTSKLAPISERDIAYYERRNQNRLYEALTSFFAEEAKNGGISKKDIADAIKRDPALITRLLAAPSNVTANTISNFLLSLGAEMDYSIVRFSERSKPNDMHPLVAKILGRLPPRINDPRVKPQKEKYAPLTEAGSSANTTKISVLPT